MSENSSDYKPIALVRRLDFTNLCRWYCKICGDSQVGDAREACFHLTECLRRRDEAADFEEWSNYYGE